jgi:hypothetical protein
MDIIWIYKNYKMAIFSLFPIKSQLFVPLQIF